MISQGHIYSNDQDDELDGELDEVGLEEEGEDPEGAEEEEQ